MNAVVDLEANELRVGDSDQKQVVPMIKLPSGHRAISLIGCEPKNLKLDRGIADKFPSFVRKQVSFIETS
eukprot:6158841-Pyramimonas_sp.AAC.1